MDKKLGKAFDADIAELEKGLDEASKNKLNGIKENIKTSVLKLNDDLGTEIKDIKTAEGKLNQDTQTQLIEVFKETTKPLQKFIDEAKNRDENNAESRALEELEKTSEETVQKAIEAKM